MSLGFILTWAYIGSGGSVLAAALILGTQNAFVVLNRRLSLSESTWLSMWVYLVLAVILALVDRHMYFARPPSVRLDPQSAPG
jgi:hypothetical protein